MSVQLHNTGKLVRASVLEFPAVDPSREPFRVLTIGFYSPKDGFQTEEWSLLVSQEALDAIRHAIVVPIPSEGAGNLPVSIPVPEPVEG